MATSTTVKGTTQNKRKRESSTRNMSRELRNALESLLCGSCVPTTTTTTTTIMMEKVNVLIENYTKKDLQEAVLKKDIYGWLPIHTACWKHAPVEVIQWLLDSDADKQTILAKTHFGQLPIHWACGHSAPVEVIQLLLDSDTEKKTIFEKDPRGRLPIHYACVNNEPVEVIQLLLQVSICDRMEQLGLLQWKLGVEKLINDMTADDSKTDKVQEIYKRLANCEEMEHTISLLALAVWRTSCLHWGDIQFKSMQQMENLRATDGALFDPSEYKRERRIKSGADVIIRGVLLFLPVDDETQARDNDRFRQT